MIAKIKSIPLKSIPLRRPAVRQVRSSGEHKKHITYLHRKYFLQDPGKFKIGEYVVVMRSDRWSVELRRLDGTVRLGHTK